MDTYNKFGIERRLYTTTEVAEILRTSPMAIRHLRRQRLGPRPWIRPGKESLIHGDDLVRWLQQQYDRDAR
jgi:hypothetical protein